MFQSVSAYGCQCGRYVEVEMQVKVEVEVEVEEEVQVHPSTDHGH